MFEAFDETLMFEELPGEPVRAALKSQFKGTPSSDLVGCGFGWEMTRPFRHARPIPSNTTVARTKSESVGIVHRSRAILCRPVPSQSS